MLEMLLGRCPTAGVVMAACKVRLRECPQESVVRRTCTLLVCACARVCVSMPSYY